VSFVAVAIGGAAVVGAGATVLASNKAAGAAKSAANTNNALQSQIYDENKAALAPYQAQGASATTAINSLLGLNGNYASYVQNNPDLLAAYNANNNGQSITDFGRDHWTNDGQYEGRTATPYSGVASADNPGFNAFRNSTGYQFQLDQGNKALTAALGAKGQLESGAAVKSALTYNQNAAAGSFNQYYADLTGQQGVGLTAASAQAGVGQNFANATSANNNAAATATGNAALAGANGVNSALGSALSAYTYNQALGSSYGGAGTNAYGINNVGNTY
jgi:hypothetical protein